MEKLSSVPVTKAVISKKNREKLSNVPEIAVEGVDAKGVPGLDRDPDLSKLARKLRAFRASL